MLDTSPCCTIKRRSNGGHYVRAEDAAGYALQINNTPYTAFYNAILMQ